MAIIQAGRHEVLIVSHGLSVATTGTHQVYVEFVAENGDTITWYGALTDKALEYTIKALEVCGWDPAEHDGRIDSLNGTQILADNRVDIVVEPETYNGKTRLKVKWINEPGGGGGTPERMNPQEASAFAAGLRQKILTQRGPAPSRRPANAVEAGVAASRARSAAAPEKPDDDFNLDDIPF